MKKNDKHIGSVLLTCIGTLILVSGIIFAICGTVLLGISFVSSAFCIFVAAYNFRIAEVKNESEEYDDEKKN